jgi:hypothetical protein
MPISAMITWKLFRDLQMYSKEKQTISFLITSVVIQHPKLTVTLTIRLFNSSCNATHTGRSG